MNVSGIVHTETPPRSKLRQWADAAFTEKETIKEKGTPPAQILSDSIIWGITRFANPGTGRDEGFPFAGDPAIFEWACFVYYRIDCWHQNHRVHKDQDDVLCYLVNEVIELFKTVAGFTNAETILINRFDFYATIQTENNPGAILFHLQQLIQRSTSEGELTTYSTNDPVVIGDFFETERLKARLSTSLETMLPALLTNIETFYQMMK